MPRLWLPVQIVIDLAVALGVRSKLGAPETYGAAVRKLAEAGILEHLRRVIAQVPDLAGSLPRPGAPEDPSP